MVPTKQRYTITTRHYALAIVLATSAYEAIKEYERLYPNDKRSIIAAPSRPSLGVEAI